MYKKNTIIDEIWAKQLVWYGHVQRMDEEKFPQKIKLDTCWKKQSRETKDEMERRSTQSAGGMWSTRWRLGGQTA
jgi:hypothetical protein